MYGIYLRCDQCGATLGGEQVTDAPFPTFSETDRLTRPARELGWTGPLTRDSNADRCPDCSPEGGGPDAPFDEVYGKSSPEVHGLPSLDEERVRNELLRTELDAAYRGTPLPDSLIPSESTMANWRRIGIANPAPPSSALPPSGDAPEK